MRLLLLEYKDLWHPEAGGAEAYVDAIAQQWSYAGHDVTIFTSQNGRAKREVHDGIAYVRRGSKFSVFRHAGSFLRKHGDEFDAVLDCVNQRPFLAHEYLPAQSTALVLHLGLELWDSEFGFPFNVIGRRILEPRWMGRLKSADRVLAISSSTVQSLDHFGINCRRIVPPATQPLGNDSGRVLAEPFHILFIGRLVRNKRPQDAIAAFQLVRRDFPHAILDIVGSGYLLRELKRHEDDHTHIRGHVPEWQKRDFFAKAHLLIVPSIREGWGMVVNEAAAAGVPTIAYDVPGLRDSVLDGTTGILSEQSPVALAKEMTALLSDAGRWSQMSAACQAKSRVWTWEEAAALILEQLLQSRGETHDSGPGMSLGGAAGSQRANCNDPRATAPARSRPKHGPVDVEPKRSDSPAQNRKESDGVETRISSGRQISTVIATAALAVGLFMRVVTALHMAWRDDEIVYVKWTGSWFGAHFWAYLLQFQQRTYPPRSPYFANPPLAMWFFGGSIRIGRIFGASDLVSARMADVALGIVAGALLFVAIRRWLGPWVASIVIVTYSVLPLIVVTNASAFLETTSTFLAVSALALLLRFNRRQTAGTCVALSVVLGLYFLTKLSLAVIPIGICALAIHTALKERRPRLALLLVIVPIALPLVVWSGFRTPSQYAGILTFLQSKFTGQISVDHLRYPFSLLSDVPFVVIAAWLGIFPSLDRRTREGFARSSPELVLVGVLPIAGLIELAVTAPTSYDYQMVPLLPFLFVAAAWSISTFAAAMPRAIAIAIGSLAIGEGVFLLFAVPFGLLPQATTPLAAAVRVVSPSVDVPYGTGSEGLPDIASFIKAHLGSKVRVAASYSDYTLAQYLPRRQLVGPWFPNQSISDLAEGGYRYAVLVDHEVPIGSLATRSVYHLHPLHQFAVDGHPLASLYEVPVPSVQSLTLSSSSWQILSKGTRVVGIRSNPNALEVWGTPVRLGADEYLTAVNRLPVEIDLKKFGIGLVVTSLGGTENLYVDLLSPARSLRGNYWRTTVFVNWKGQQQIVVPFDAFKPVRLISRQSLPSFGKPLLIRFATDSQVDTVPYIGVSTTLPGSS